MFYFWSTVISTKVKWQESGYWKFKGVHLVSKKKFSVSFQLEANKKKQTDEIVEGRPLIKTDNLMQTHPKCEKYVHKFKKACYDSESRRRIMIFCNKIS